MAYYTPWNGFRCFPPVLPLNFPLLHGPAHYHHLWIIGGCHSLLFLILVRERISTLDLYHDSQWPLSYCATGAQLCMTYRHSVASCKFRNDAYTRPSEVIFHVCFLLLVGCFIISLWHLQKPSIPIGGGLNSMWRLVVFCTFSPGMDSSKNVAIDKFSL